MHFSFQAIRDFAGPVATIIASITAAVVTFKIQDENRRLKKDELRLNLFNRRYKTYIETIDYIGYIQSKSEHSITEELPISQSFGQTVLESRFTCSTRTQAHLEQIRETAFEYVGTLEELKDMDASEERREKLQKRREVGARLNTLRAGLPKVFEQDLRVRYLD